jgi:choline-sulfatase
MPKNIYDYICQTIELPNPEIKDPANARQRIAMYYANVAFLDECLGQVLGTLKELGIEDDTIVIYSSDHGEMLGEHGLWQKFVFYEPSVGVPLIFRLPGVTKPGTVCRAPVSQVSLMATILDLCGIPVPEGLDGEPLTPFLAEPEKVSTKPVFSQYALRTKNAKALIRKGIWKYSHYTSDTPELYNQRDDPHEMNNVALLPAYKPRMESLRSELLQWSDPAAV